jgi:hypothetical protein
LTRLYDTLIAIDLVVDLYRCMELNVGTAPTEPTLAPSFDNGPDQVGVDGNPSDQRRVKASCSTTLIGVDRVAGVLG